MPFFRFHLVSEGSFENDKTERKRKELFVGISVRRLATEEFVIATSTMFIGCARSESVTALYREIGKDFACSSQWNRSCSDLRLTK